MRRVALALIAILSATPAVAEERKAVDVALVLALDVSGSVTEDNWRTQRDGVASAVNSDQFAQAVRRGQTGRVAIAVVNANVGPLLAGTAFHQSLHFHQCQWIVQVVMQIGHHVLPHPLFGG